jgi:fatty acid omega-hydroxylase
MDPILLAFSVLVLAYVLCTFSGNYMGCSQRGLKPGLMWGPIWFPVIGNLPLITKFRDDLILLMIQSFEHNNFNTFFWYLPGQRAVNICTPENLEYVLKTNFKNYPKGNVFFDMFEELLGHGIFNIDGQPWFHARKTASHLFKTSTLRDCMLNVFLEHGKQLSSCLKNNHSKGPLDMQDYFFRF